MLRERSQFDQELVPPLAAVGQQDRKLPRRRNGSVPYTKRRRKLLCHSIIGRLSQLRRAVMSFRKPCFFSMLATLVAFAAVGSVNRPALQGETQPTSLLPVQSKDTKSLGAGKLL